MGQTRVPGLYSWGPRGWGRKGAPIVIPSPVHLYVMVVECQTEWRFGLQWHWVAPTLHPRVTIQMSVHGQDPPSASLSMTPSLMSSSPLPTVGSCELNAARSHSHPRCTAESGAGHPAGTGWRGPQADFAGTQVLRGMAQLPEGGEGHAKKRLASEHPAEKEAGYRGHGWMRRELDDLWRQRD